MKLVFLCSSLAPGRDGVGDYVRQLSAACGEFGHVVLPVALHDRHLPAGSAVVHGSREVRLPAALPWETRAAILAELLAEFDPHWISWQMVPYGFHPKGILPPGCFRLIDVTRSWPNHVMLHELWLGLADRDRLRPRLVGALQRRQLLQFLHRLRPACLHTSNPAYQLALAHHGWPTELLPLFGNMPVIPVDPARARDALEHLVGDALPPRPRWIGALFGTIHPQWNHQPTLAFLRAAASTAKRPIGLVALGRSGAHGTRLLDELGGTTHDIRVVSVGPRPAERISELIQAADFGLATHPWALIEKSGSTATFLDHGLPVLVPRDDWRSRHGTLDAPRHPLLCRLDALTPELFPRWLSERREPSPLLPQLAARFVAHLEGARRGGALVA